MFTSRLSLRYQAVFLNRGNAFRSKNCNLSLRNLSTISKSKKKFSAPLIAGAAAVGGAIVGIYTYFGKSKEPIIDLVAEDRDDFVPFVDPLAEENLSLLEEFGAVPYLLVGAGSASFTAFRAIRTSDPTAKVVMIGDEEFHPYMRPPLSKELWYEESADVAETYLFKQWNGKQRSIFYEHPDFYFTVKDLLDNKNGGLSIIRGKKVVKIDPVSQIVFLNDGKHVSYNKCLIATGARPQNLPVFEEAKKDVRKHVTLFRTARDFQKLEKISRKAEIIAIIGGGYLGSELAFALAKRSKTTNLKLIQVFPETGNMAKVLPEYLSKWVTNKIEEEGVQVHSNSTIESVTKEGSNLKLLLSSGKEIEANHVIVAVGAEPNTDFAAASGLEVDPKLGGLLVNTELEARKNLYAAGDVCCFYDTKLGRRRVEHHDHAIVSGRLAGENMAGAGKPYWHQSMFWSDLGPDVGYEGIGIVDSSLPTVAVFSKPSENTESPSESPSEENVTNVDVQKTENVVERSSKANDGYEKGVVFYLRDNIVVGIVLWNIFTKMSVARKIISESKSYDDLTEVAKLFELYKTE